MATEVPARAYPEPPWEMHGRGIFAAFRVPVRDLQLPRGMAAITFGGQAVGLLAYIEYLSPSPLRYRELIFMPCLLRAETKEGRRSVGYHVARMYVDSEASLRGGRELWALPKTLAHFVSTEGGVDIEAEDGTSMSLGWNALGPKLPLTSRVVTLQREEDSLVRFRGDFKAKAQLARVKVTRFKSSDPGWRGFDPRRCLPLPGAHFASFVSQMQPPRRDEAKAI